MCFLRTHSFLFTLQISVEVAGTSCLSFFYYWRNSIVDKILDRTISYNRIAFGFHFGTQRTSNRWVLPDSCSSFLENVFVKFRFGFKFLIFLFHIMSQLRNQRLILLFQWFFTFDCIRIFWFLYFFIFLGVVALLGLFNESFRIT